MFLHRSRKHFHRHRILQTPSPSPDSGAPLPIRNLLADSGTTSPTAVLPVYSLNSTQVFVAHTSLSDFVAEGNYSFVETVDSGENTVIKIPLMYFDGSVCEPQASFTYPSIRIT